MSKARQLSFDLTLAADSAAEPAAPAPEPAVKQSGPPARTVRRRLRRAALRWVTERWQPAGVGVNVVTRITRYRADVAAFCSRSVRNRNDEGPGRLLVPSRTIIVQCHADREECWPDCGVSEQMLPELRNLKGRLREVEAAIRRNEPGLKTGDTLFEEYAEWNYERSCNPDYHRLRKRINKIEHAVYRGTRFEQIRAAHLADLLYLAVPAGTVTPEELADGWGLPWVEDNLAVRVMLEPEEKDVLAANRTHLVQNIAASASRSVLFANGLRGTPRKLTFVKRPRGHRRTARPRLSD